MSSRRRARPYRQKADYVEIDRDRAVSINAQPAISADGNRAVALWVRGKVAFLDSTQAIRIATEIVNALDKAKETTHE